VGPMPRHLLVAPWISHTRSALRQSGSDPMRNFTTSAPSHLWTERTDPKRAPHRWPHDPGHNQSSDRLVVASEIGRNRVASRNIYRKLAVNFRQTLNSALSGHPVNTEVCVVASSFPNMPRRPDSSDCLPLYSLEVDRRYIRASVFGARRDLFSREMTKSYRRREACNAPDFGRPWVQARKYGSKIIGGRPEASHQKLRNWRPWRRSAKC
jgi:hypothetical protein